MVLKAEDVGINNRSGTEKALLCKATEEVTNVALGESCELFDRGGRYECLVLKCF